MGYSLGRVLEGKWLTRPKRQCETLAESNFTLSSAPGRILVQVDVFSMVVNFCDYVVIFKRADIPLPAKDMKKLFEKQE